MTWDSIYNSCHILQESQKWLMFTFSNEKCWRNGGRARSWLIEQQWWGRRGRSRRPPPWSTHPCHCDWVGRQRPPRSFCPRMFQNGQRALGQEKATCCATFSSLCQPLRLPRPHRSYFGDLISPSNLTLSRKRISSPNSLTSLIQQSRTTFLD